MLHLLHGTDSYSCAATLEALIARLAGESASFGVRRLDAKSATWAALRDECLALPFLTPTHIVVVQGLLAAWGGRGDSESSSGKPKPAEFVSFLRQMPGTTILIHYEGELTPGNRYLKELETSGLGEVTLFTLPQGAGRQQWVNRTVQQRGGSIEPAAAALLSERSIGDLWQLSGEIDKMLAYTAPLYGITRDDVLKLVDAEDESTAYMLVDALATKQTARAVDLLTRQLADGTAPEQILALVNARIRDLIWLNAAQAQGVPASEVQSSLGWTPGRLANVQRSRQQFSPEELRDAGALLVATDHALKSRPTHERPTITLLTLYTIAVRQGCQELCHALLL